MHIQSLPTPMSPGCILRSVSDIYGDVPMKMALRASLRAFAGSRSFGGFQAMAHVKKHLPNTESGLGDRSAETDVTYWQKNVFSR